MGKRKRRAKHASMWVATQDLRRSAAFIDAMESKVWIQPFDDHPAQQVTRFGDGRSITDFA
jgi:hypothetical protein